MCFTSLNGCGLLQRGSEQEQLIHKWQIRSLREMTALRLSRSDGIKDIEVTAIHAPTFLPVSLMDFASVICDILKRDEEKYNLPFLIFNGDNVK